MMIPDITAKLLNDQVRNEFFAFWTYQAMAYSLDTQGYKGFSKWFAAQAAEEQTHAMKIAEYLLAQGVPVKLESLPAPKNDYASVEEVVAIAVEHELMVTKQVHAIANAAADAGDYATRKFIDWLVEEQVEEVATVTEMLDMVKKCDTPGQLLMAEQTLVRGAAAAE